MRELGWELVRAAEAAALAAAGQVGRGDKLAADRDATRALRACLDGIDFTARVAIGEGEKDGAPGLFLGDLVGRTPSVEGQTPIYDLAVDPIDGTTQAARGGPEALTALALGPGDSLFSTRTYYMKKLAVGPELARRLGGLPAELLHAPAGRLIDVVCQALGCGPAEVTAWVLDRPRHERLLRELREAGCRIRLQDCDVSATVTAALPGAESHLCLGVGGAPEAVLSAAALKCLGGALLGALADPAGNLLDGRVLGHEDLVRAGVLFAAAGITDGSLLPGVRTTREGARVHSLLMDSADGSVRRIETFYPGGEPHGSP